MTDRPILFSAPMVRALLDGRKTQTRRVLPVDPSWELDPCRQAAADAGHYWFTSDPEMPGSHLVKPRFAKGDRLWVRETWRTEARHDAVKPTKLPRDALISFDADYLQEPNDGCRGRTRVSIHMPRWASRLTLTVTDVRVQWLQEISEEDAIAEGIEAAPPPHEGWRHYAERDGLPGIVAVDSYRALWNSINGPGSWRANPWIVALTFTVEKRNIGA